MNKLVKLMNKVMNKRTTLLVASAHEQGHEQADYTFGGFSQGQGPALSAFLGLSLSLRHTTTAAAVAATTTTTAKFR